MFKAQAEVLQLVLSFTSLLSIAIAVVSWYSASVQKKYASQRDFQHLKNNYEQLSQGQAHIMKDIDAGFDQAKLDMIEVKNFLKLLDMRLGGEGSSGWMRKPHDQ